MANVESPLHLYHWCVEYQYRVYLRMQFEGNNIMWFAGIQSCKIRLPNSNYYISDAIVCAETPHIAMEKLAAAISGGKIKRGYKASATPQTIPPLIFSAEFQHGLDKFVGVLPSLKAPALPVEVQGGDQIMIWTPPSKPVHKLPENSPKKEKPSKPLF